jgi:hypothetical protein
MEMGAQLRERHNRIDCPAVLDNVEVVGCKIDNARAVRARDIGGSDVPLGWYGPVKNLGPRRDLTEFERDVISEDRERFSYTIPGNAPANREDSFDERHHGVPAFVGELCVPKSAR